MVARKNKQIYNKRLKTRALNGKGRFPVPVKLYPRRQLVQCQLVCP